jgi:DNA-directed RNA polymerase
LSIYKKEIDMNVSLNLPTERSTSIGVNIIHSVDAYVAREMVRRCNDKGFSIYTIHDGFNCHPNYATEMKDTYNEILADILDSRLLEDIISQIIGEDVTSLVKDIKRDEILESLYSIS